MLSFYISGENPCSVRKFLIFLAVLFALIGGTLVYLMFLRPNLVISKEAAKERFKEPGSHFFKWRDTEFHYVDEGKGPTVLMVHGFGGNFTNFRPLAHIMEDSFRVVRVDLPGFGLSDLPNMGPNPQFVPMNRAFMRYFIDTVLHVDSLYIIGNSLGGWVSWETAERHPDKVKKLVLLNSAGYDIANIKAHLFNVDLFKTEFYHLLTQRGLPLRVHETIAHKVRSPWEQINEQEAITNNGISNRAGNHQNFVRMAASTEEPDTTLIPKIACPTLVVWGKQDNVIPYQHAYKFQRDIPNCQVILYDTCGHVPMMEYPQRLNKDIRQFFKE